MGYDFYVCYCIYIMKMKKLKRIIWEYWIQPWHPVNR